jgi:NAD-dependent deacetylase
MAETTQGAGLDVGAGFEQQIAELMRLLESSRHCVAFTGAGVSTLSGIRDFRGKDGLYKTANADRMFDIEVFRADPSVYYTMARDFIYGLEDKVPSVVHCALALLESRGIVKSVITQNIDLLHQKAGSSRVIEIHGSPSVHRCVQCGKAFPFAHAATVARSGAVPRCTSCDGVLKPDIVFFGEALPERAIAEARDEACAADLMLVLGTSLVVYPAASLPEMTAEAGGTIVVVNEQPTRLDGRARLRFSDLEVTFDALMKEITP